MIVAPYVANIPFKEIDFVEGKRRARDGCISFNLDRCLEFSTGGLESYAFARWEPLVYDAIVLTAAIEFADMSVRRPSGGWARDLQICVPVHDPAHWNSGAVQSSLNNAIRFLTGDKWSIKFVPRTSAAPSPASELLSLPIRTEAVLAFSDGMDSRAVAGIVGAEIGAALVRVRVGSKKHDRPSNSGRREPFAAIPYKIKRGQPNRETSARSRGFKFSMISGIAAYLSDAPQIILPESGQGALGPALVVVGHKYPDYRNHPCFTKRMADFLKALFGRPFMYSFPRIWHTKGETLREFIRICGDTSWVQTRSCWQGSRSSSVDGQLRQCGVCAACMLRRLSVHAAEQVEPENTYVCNHIDAPTLKESVDDSFNKFGKSYEEYAIAGTLHLDHLADMAKEELRPEVKRHAILIASALDIEIKEVEERLLEMLKRHQSEWSAFLSSLDDKSFVRKWAKSEK